MEDKTSPSAQIGVGKNMIRAVFNGINVPVLGEHKAMILNDYVA